MSALARLERLKDHYGSGDAVAKLALLRQLEREPQTSAAALRRLHELLCWLHAYPDDAALREQVRRMLWRFDRRADLRRHRQALADSGMAGTDIHYRFFAGQAQWLASRWPAQFSLLRDDPAAEARLGLALQALLTPAEAAAQIELKADGFALLDRVRGPVPDAVFLQQRIAALPGSGHLREAFADALDLNHRLAAGPDTPSRSRAGVELQRAVVPVWRNAPPPRQRPDLRVELARAPRRIRRLGLRDAEAVIEQARGAMVTRARSLEAFSFANPADAWWVDDGEGLAYAIVGVLPERRHPLASFYGGLTLRNGVPIGYVQSDVSGRSAALSFNTFDTFRGGEAGHSFARWLAALHHLLGCSSFHIEPYQLGHHNDEALQSGAWWFYAKLGFAPRDAGVARLAAQERRRLHSRAGARSSAATLQRLASCHLHFDLGPPLPRLPLADTLLRGAAALAALAAVDQPRETALAQACDDLAQRCGLGRWRPRGAERQAWAAMAPCLLQLPLASWSTEERTALAAVVRSKAARSERTHLAAWQAHPRLDAALHAWAGVAP